MMIRARKIRAKHPGTCRACGLDIVSGDLVWWCRGQGARHDDCDAAKRRADGCPNCSGRGWHWYRGGSIPCKACDGTSSREVYEFAKSGGHPRKPGYEPMSPFVDQTGSEAAS